ncbi:MAG: diphthine synthase [Thermoplasmata archaeon]|nr:diphthine synthase [Thermoplasmata archaeon]
MVVATRGELRFVGMGLFDERDLSRRSLEALSGCATIFAEEYTSVLAPGSLDRLSAELDRPIVRLDRAALESQTPVLAELARGRVVGLLVAGDPFAATTHVALRTAAETAGHSWTYWPNASILTAASGYLGLQPYRFGRTVSLPFPEPGFAPASPIEVAGRNRREGLHTLVLLDLRPSEGRFLTADRALEILAERDPLGAHLPLEAEIAVVARMGSPTAGAWFGDRAALHGIEFGPPLHALVVPAKTLHFEEEAAIARFRWPRGRAAPAQA